MGWQGCQPESESIHVSHWIFKERHCVLSGHIGCFGLEVQLICALPEQLKDPALLALVRFAFAAATAFPVSNRNDIDLDGIPAGALHYAQILHQSYHAERPGSSLAVHVSTLMNIVCPLRLPNPQSESKVKRVAKLSEAAIIRQQGPTTRCEEREV
jgi:hypothetical protein